MGWNWNVQAFTHSTYGKLKFNTYLIGLLMRYNHWTSLDSVELRNCAYGEGAD